MRASARDIRHEAKNKSKLELKKNIKYAHGEKSLFLKSITNCVRKIRVPKKTIIDRENMW